MADWTKDEVDLIVQDYFSMLQAEIEGRPFSKSKHRKELSPKLAGRSDGSIEFKHQNISAVLVEMGLPYIQGYLPRQNYQKELYDAVDTFIKEHPTLLVQQQTPTRRGHKYWAFIANPKVYDIESALRSLDKDTWTTKGADVNVGDGIIFWRTLKDDKRGIVALGRVISAPESMKAPSETLRFFPVSPSNEEELRVWVQYKPIPKQLWMEEDTAGFLEGLTVAKGQGGKPYHITFEQWNEILRRVGGWEGFAESKFPIISYSWIVLSNHVLIKQIDRSVFFHRGTGIPIEIRKFFGIDTLEKGQKRRTTLYHSSSELEAYFEADNQPTPRTRLFWNSDFADLLHNEFPDWYRAYEKEEVAEGEVPKIRFETKGEGFSIQFIHPKEIELDIQAETEEILEPRSEGKEKYIITKQYERDPVNRKKAVELHGLSCVICGFNFEETYGDAGKGYIAVHHTKPLSSLNGETLVNPETDLVPVCANCHVMIHRRKDKVLSIETMKEIITRTTVDQ